MSDADIDSMTADGAQDTTRWADTIAAMAEAVARLEVAQRKAALVGGSAEPANPARRKAMLRSPTD